MTHHAQPSSARCARALELAAHRPASRSGPTRASAACCSTPTARTVAEGFHRGAGHARTPRSTRWPRPGTAPAARPPSSPSSPATTPAAPGPCAQALIAAGVRRVVLRPARPQPGRRRGRGRRCARPGVEVEPGLLADEARALNRAWTFAVEHGRPFVTWKFATTLDGRSAAADGTSRWITSTAARRDTHRLRGACDAMLVGTGTVAVDDPQLTVRDEHDQPLRAASRCAW